MEKWKYLIVGEKTESLIVRDENNYICEIQQREDGFEIANLIVTMQNAVASIANKYGSDPQRVAEQIEPAIEALIELSERYEIGRHIKPPSYWQRVVEILSAIRSK